MRIFSMFVLLSEAKWVSSITRSSSEKFKWVKAAYATTHIAFDGWISDLSGLIFLFHLYKLKNQLNAIYLYIICDDLDRYGRRTSFMIFNLQVHNRWTVVVKIFVNIIYNSFVRGIPLWLIAIIMPNPDSTNRLEDRWILGIYSVRLGFVGPKGESADYRDSEPIQEEVVHYYPRTSLVSFVYWHWSSCVNFSVHSCASFCVLYKMFHWSSFLLTVPQFLYTALRAWRLYCTAWNFRS